MAETVKMLIKSEIRKNTMLCLLPAVAFVNMIEIHDIHLLKNKHTKFLSNIYEN